MDCKTTQQKIMPYIERKLNDREMKEFIEHIRECETCSEELEVYFTIYYALERLDDDQQESFNMKELLEKDIAKAEHDVSNRDILKFYRRLFMVLTAIIMAVVIFTGVQTLIRGSFEETTIYSLFSSQEDDEGAVNVPVRETKASETDDKPEQETNRKRQVIVTVPETEKWVRESAEEPEKEIDTGRKGS